MDAWMGTAFSLQLRLRHLFAKITSSACTHFYGQSLCVKWRHQICTLSQRMPHWGAQSFFLFLSSHFSSSLVLLWYGRSQRQINSQTTTFPRLLLLLRLPPLFWSVIGMFVCSFYGLFKNTYHKIYTQTQTLGKSRKRKNRDQWANKKSLK